MNKAPAPLRQSSRRLISALVALFVVGFTLNVFGPEAAPARGVFSVITFGAQPDDAIDDTAAIQAAINAASRAGGGTVALPGGTFQVTSWLYPADNVSIVGVPGETVLSMPARISPTYFFHGSGLHNVAFEGLTLRANSTADNVHGVAMYGAIDCRIQKVQLENLGYGLKLGSGPIASGWLIENLTARNCQVPLFALDITDSSFVNLDLGSYGLAGSGYSHCIYLAKECRRLLFKDVNLTSPSGYALHLWIESGGTSSDLTFSNVTIDATNGQRPVVISSGWSNVSFRNVTLKMPTSADGVCVRLESPSGITFDGFTGSGGYALFGTYVGISGPARDITFRNGSYTGPSLQPPSAAERNIVNLVMDNVALNPGSTTTTSRSTTSTTLSASTTTTVPATTTVPTTTTTTVSRTTTTTALLTTTTHRTTTTAPPRNTTTSTAAPPQPVDTGEVARFVLLTERTWQTVLVPLTTYLPPSAPVARVEFLLDDRVLRVDTSRPFICWLDARGITLGLHTLHATAFDPFGNVCASGSTAASW